MVGEIEREWGCQSKVLGSTHLWLTKTWNLQRWQKKKIPFMVGERGVASGVLQDCVVTFLDGSILITHDNPYTLGRALVFLEGFGLIRMQEIKVNEGGKIFQIGWVFLIQDFYWPSKKLTQSFGFKHCPGGEGL